MARRVSHKPLTKSYRDITSLNTLSSSNPWLSASLYLDRAVVAPRGVMSRKRAAQFDEGFPFVAHQRCTGPGGLSENPIAMNGLGFLTLRSRGAVLMQSQRQW